MMVVTDGIMRSCVDYLVERGIKGIKCGIILEVSEKLKGVLH